MAGQIFLYIDGIPGESTSNIFTNWIDVASFSIGVAMEIDMEARTGSGGGTSGAADPEDLSVETKMSVASVVLFQACALGAVIPRCRLIQCNVVNTELYSVSEYSMGDSIISGVSVSGSGGGIPDQSVSINYGSIIWRYHVYNHYMPSVEVACLEREWSPISANPQKADANAQSAATIAREGCFSPPKKEDDPPLHHYDNYGSSANVSFKHGKSVFMDPNAKPPKRS